VNKPLIAIAREELVNTGLPTKETFSAAVLSSAICLGRVCKELSSFAIPSFILSEMPSSTEDAIFS
jgi:hypothetical protein